MGPNLPHCFKAAWQVLPLKFRYKSDESREDFSIMGSKGKLDPRVIDLMNFLVDVEIYTAAMMEFEINIL